MSLDSSILLAAEQAVQQLSTTATTAAPAAAAAVKAAASTAAATAATSAPAAAVSAIAKDPTVAAVGEAVVDAADGAAAAAQVHTSNTTFNECTFAYCMSCFRSFECHISPFFSPWSHSVFLLTRTFSRTVTLSMSTGIKSWYQVVTGPAISVMGTAVNGGILIVIPIVGAVIVYSIVAWIITQTFVYVDGAHQSVGRRSLLDKSDWIIFV
jgi:hypothetical protein